MDKNKTNLKIRTKIHAHTAALTWHSSNLTLVLNVLVEIVIKIIEMK